MTVVGPVAGAAEFSLNGERLVAEVDGAVFWPARATLIVADLHFEKGSAFARKGVLLPPYDTRATLDRLAAAVDRRRPERVISLGDAFHDRGAEGRMDDADLARLQALIVRIDWLWILGNHDPAPPARLGGGVERGAEIGRLRFVHEPTSATKAPAPGEVAGHLHPCARVRSTAGVLRRRCFALGDERLVAPAFGAYAGGLNILDDAFGDLFNRPPTALVMGGRGVYPMPSEALAPDRPVRRVRARLTSPRGTVTSPPLGKRVRADP